MIDQFAHALRRWVQARIGGAAPHDLEGLRQEITQAAPTLVANGGETRLTFIDPSTTAADEDHPEVCLLAFDLGKLGAVKDGDQILVPVGLVHALALEIEAHAIPASVSVVEAARLGRESASSGEG